MWSDQIRDELVKHSLPSIYILMEINCIKYLRAGKLFILNINIKDKWEEDLFIAFSFSEDELGSIFKLGLGV